MAEWLSAHGLELVLALMGGAWFVSRTLVNLGEWKRGVEAPVTLTEDRLQQELRDMTHKARNLIVADLSANFQKMEQRFDKAGEKTSELASRVQGLPTRDDVSAIWKELNHMRDLLEAGRDARTHLVERLARLEGRGSR